MPAVSAQPLPDQHIRCRSTGINIQRFDAQRCSTHRLHRFRGVRQQGEACRKIVIGRLAVNKHRIPSSEHHRLRSILCRKTFDPQQGSTADGCHRRNDYPLVAASADTQIPILIGPVYLHQPLIAVMERDAFVQQRLGQLKKRLFHRLGFGQIILSGIGARLRPDAVCRIHFVQRGHL